MKQTLFSTFILLIAMTLLATFSVFKVNPEITVKVIIALSIAKFWLVAFQFMELKKAHPFWKYLILGFGGLMGIILVILL